MTGRPVIGLLVNDLVGAYQYGQWIGIEERTRELGFDVVSFNGGEMRSAWLNKRMRNAAFELSTPENVDALILMAPSVANTLNANEIAEFAASIAPRPLVTAGFTVPGFPTVLVDNAAGMEAVVEHVVGFHGRKRPVFLGGPLQNPEAVERRDAFLKVLERHRIPQVRELDLVGQFDFGIGRDLVLELLDRKIPFDAVVAANDEMALGAMEALKRRKVRIPEDVIVTGFDDIEDAMFSTPALTSVRQPLFDQGRLCVSILADLLQGGSASPINHQPARLVARGSCGCHSASIAEGRSESIIDSRDSAFMAASDGFGSEACLKSVRSEMGPEDQQILASPEFAHFFAQLVREATGIVKGISIVPFEKLLQAQAREEDDNDRWQLFVSRLRRGAMPFFPRDTLDAAEIEGMFHQLRLVVHEREVQRSAYKSMRVERWTRQLHETGSHLITTFDVGNLVESLAQDLPLLQLNTCHILVQEKGDPQGQLRLILSYSHGKRIPLPPDGAPRPVRGVVRDLVQSDVERGTLAIEPLFFESTPLGFALVELGSRRGMLLDALRTQISAALMGARLAVEVRARTKELEQALETLEKNQKQLVLSEKMASLGKLTAGIAHEMNTPLSAMRSSLEEMKQLTKEYSDSIGDPEVTPDDHKAIAADMAKSLDIAIRAGDKASGFVRSIKSQTRDMGAKDKQVFDCVRVVDEAILLLSHALRASRCEARMEHSAASAPVLGIPDRLQQVVTNLVTNAIDAMEGTGGGIIRISVETRDRETSISVADSGCGIPQENLGRIFDPLFTTKPVGKGTGLGLTIIHDIVHGDFGGKIEVDSIPGKGTTFTIRLPEAAGG